VLVDSRAGCTRDLKMEDGVESKLYGQWAPWPNHCINCAMAHTGHRPSWAGVTHILSRAPFLGRRISNYAALSSMRVWRGLLESRGCPLVKKSTHLNRFNP
jgi:hypothetical protein